MDFWVFPKENRTGFAFILNGQYFFSQAKVGIRVLENDQVVPAPDWERFRDEKLKAAVTIPYKEDTVILGNAPMSPPVVTPIWATMISAPALAMATDSCGSRA